MTSQPLPRPGLSSEEGPDYRQAQNDQDELMDQVADREAQIENWLIDSYGEYSIAWTHPEIPGSGVAGT